jgi:hypothetical protein
MIQPFLFRRFKKALAIEASLALGFLLLDVGTSQTHPHSSHGTDITGSSQLTHRFFLFTTFLFSCEPSSMLGNTCATESVGAREVLVWEFL